MNDWFDAAIFHLVSTTAIVALAALLGGGLLRLLRVRSTAVHRLVWLMVLLQGFVYWRLPVDLPLIPGQPKGAPSSDVLHQDKQSDIIFDEGAAEWFDSKPDPAPLSPQPLSSLNWRHVAVFAWLTGMLVLLLRTLFSLLDFQRRLPQQSTPEDVWLNELAAAQKELGVRRDVRLCVCEQFGPAVAWSPGVYLVFVPELLWRRLSAAQRASILRHELAHVARGDLWKSLLARLLATPQWFNPLAWRAVARFEACAEWACDDIVRNLAEKRGDGQPVYDYARALLSLATDQRPQPALPHVAAGGGELTTRIRRLLSPGARKESNMKRCLVVAMVLSVSLLGLVQLRIVAADPPIAEATFTDTSAEQNETDSGATAKESVPKTSTPNPSATTSREAVIDMSRVFKQSKAFASRSNALKKHIEELEQEQQRAYRRVQEMEAVLQNAGDGQVERMLMRERALSKAQLDLQVQSMKLDARASEAEMYHKTYEEIRAVVAAYAREHGIRTVRKSNAVVGDGEQVDPRNSQQVLERINREIVYSEPQYIDITDAVLERLNSADSGKRE